MMNGICKYRCAGYANVGFKSNRTFYSSRTNPASQEHEWSTRLCPLHLSSAKSIFSFLLPDFVAALLRGSELHQLDQCCLFPSRRDSCQLLHQLLWLQLDRSEECHCGRSQSQQTGGASSGDACVSCCKQRGAAVCERLLLLGLQGCYELVTAFIESNMGIIAGVTFGIAFSQVYLLFMKSGW